MSKKRYKRVLKRLCPVIQNLVDSDPVNIAFNKALSFEDNPLILEGMCNRTKKRYRRIMRLEYIRSNATRIEFEML